MAKAEISLEELGLDGGDGGKGALTAIPRTPPTYSNIELIAVDSIRIPPDRQRGDKINGRGEDESIKGLEDSFDAIGIFGAIIVSKDSLPPEEGGKQYKLIAGRRRFVACRSPHIPAQVVTPSKHKADPGSCRRFSDFREIDAPARRCIGHQRAYQQARNAAVAH
jgi:ParB-like nuclease domain